LAGPFLAAPSLFEQIHPIQLRTTLKKSPSPDLIDLNRFGGPAFSPPYVPGLLECGWGRTRYVRGQ